MTTPREDLGNVRRIKEKLEEARRFALEAGYEADPNGPHDGTAPGTITPLIDAAIGQTEDVACSLRSRTEENDRG